jgi:hypothetical protein
MPCFWAGRADLELGSREYERGHSSKLEATFGVNIERELGSRKSK